METKQQSIENILQALSISDKDERNEKLGMSPGDMSTTFKTAFSEINDQEYGINVLTRLLNTLHTKKSEKLSDAIRHNIMYTLESTIPKVDNNQEKLHLYQSVIRHLEKDDHRWVRDFGRRTVLKARDVLPGDMKQTFGERIEDRIWVYKGKKERYEATYGSSQKLKLELDDAEKEYNAEYKDVKTSFYTPRKKEIEQENKESKKAKESYEKKYQVKLSGLVASLEMDAERKRKYFENVFPWVQDSSDRTYEILVKETDDLLKKDKKIKDDRNLLELQMEGHYRLTPLKAKVDSARRNLEELEHFTGTIAYLKLLRKEF
jgi:F0F1-type ATP synthase membrane subunit b/b'